MEHVLPSWEQKYDSEHNQEFINLELVATVNKVSLACLIQLSRKLFYS